MNYSINSGAWQKVFAVPSQVVDDYILLASSAAIKTLLYLLRHGGESFSNEDISKSLKLSEDAVSDALVFWEQAGLLVNNEGSLSPAELQIHSFIAEAKGTDVKITPVNKVNIKEKTTALTPKEIAARINESGEVKFLFNEAEKIIGRTLNHTEQRGLLSIHDYIGLSTDIILILLNYCRSVDKLSVRYAESVAANWADLGITTHQQADELIKKLSEENRSFSKIKQIFGIERNLNSKEKEHITRWLTVYQMTFDMIEEAYFIMCKKTSRISFAYIDKILQSWSAKGLRTPEDVKREQESFKAAKEKNKEDDAPSYDLEKFEEMALKYTPKG